MPVVAVRSNQAARGLGGYAEAFRLAWDAPTAKERAAAAADADHLLLTKSVTFIPLARSSRLDLVSPKFVRLPRNGFGRWLTIRGAGFAIDAD